MNNVNQIIPVKITIISPVHIGSGEKINPSLETINKEAKIAFLSLDGILEKVAGNKRQLYEISRKIEGDSTEPLQKIIPPKVIEESIMYTVKDRRTAYSREIDTFLKDGRNVPLLPGTSLKGAIRTLVFAAYIEEHNKILADIERNPKKANPERLIFGRDAQKDPMKIVKTEDIYFETDKLSLRTVKMFDISNDGSRCGFKKMGRNGGLASIDNATAINVEAIDTGTTLKSEIRIEKYYLDRLNNLLRDVDRDWYKDFFSDFFNMLAVSSKYQASEYIKEEIKFFEKFGKTCKVDKVIEFYKNLRKEVENSNNTIYIRMAWGIGWKGMTGNTYKDRVLTKIVEANRLDKGRGAITFPKTRRLFTEQNEFGEYAAYPAGWIKIERR